MGWDYRVMQYPDESGEAVFGIVEIYFDEDNNLTSYTDPPFVVGSSIEDLSTQLDEMKAVLGNAVVKPENFPEPDGEEMDSEEGGAEDDVRVNGKG